MNNEYKIPTHVGIIVDGNGRWAQKRGLTRSMGHKAGADRLKDIAVYALSKGIKVLSVFVFSTENFKRSEEEVNYLMELFLNMFKRERDFFKKHNIKVVFSGLKEPLRDDVWNAMLTLVEETKNNTGGIYNMCLNYGGQSEIVEATKKIARDVLAKNIDINDLNEKSFYNYLFNNLPPMDLLIRTSGEIRISNFMLYQAAYAEMYFPQTYFPDFDSKEFDKAIDVYNKRDRRFGGINYNKKSTN